MSNNEKEEPESEEVFNAMEEENFGKKEKSLGSLCGGFIKLFFECSKVLSLEQAAMRLTDNDQRSNQLKTKIRRLYDIANVLSALGLIKKVYTPSKKPAFEWIGLSGLHLFMENLRNLKAVSPKKIEIKRQEKPAKTKEEKEPTSEQKVQFQSENSAFKIKAKEQDGCIDEMINQETLKMIQKMPQGLFPMFITFLESLNCQSQNPKPSFQPRTSFETPARKRTYEERKPMTNEPSTVCTDLDLSNDLLAKRASASLGKENISPFDFKSPFKRIKEIPLRDISNAYGSVSRGTFLERLNRSESCLNF